MEGLIMLLRRVDGEEGVDNDNVNWGCESEYAKRLYYGEIRYVPAITNFPRSLERYVLAVPFSRATRSSMSGEPIRRVN